MKVVSSSPTRHGVRSATVDPAARVIEASLWLAVTLVALVQLHDVWDTWWRGSDFGPTVLSVSALVHHQPLDPAYVYPPGLLVLLAPFSFLPGWGHAGVAGLATEAVGLAISFGLMARVVVLPRIVGPVLALAALLSGQLVYALRLENLTLVLLPLAAGCYLAAARHKWWGYALLLGVSFVVKPMLVAFLLILLARHRWRECAFALVIPIALSGIALALAQHPEAFLRNAVDVLLNNAGPRGDNSNLSGAADLLHLPAQAGDAARITLALASIAAIVLLRRKLAGSERDIWVTQVGTAAILLCFVFAHTFYGLLLLPLGFACVAKPRAVSSWIALVGLACTLFPLAVPGLEGANTIGIAARLCVCGGMVLVVLAGVTRALATPRNSQAPRTVVS